MPRLILALFALCATCSARAQTMTGLVDITMVRTGWNTDSFGIVTAQPIINPAGCQTPDGYVSTITRPGYQTFLSAALTAFALDTPVVVTIHNSECLSGRPVVIGINVTR
jgi:hypothetical protein